MTVLQEVLLEEYDRILRTEKMIVKELDGLPNGYISRKKIRGREYCYLQWRDGGKVRSLYIKPSEVDEYEKKIALRKKDQQALKELAESKRMLARALGKELINEYAAE